ncbi:MAG: BMP family ABC transporter substrate-binding protein [Clostridia bacterium]|nr:BMP family ABC transporter substrate-binding protein [Clostridia bacterium]
MKKWFIVFVSMLTAVILLLAGCGENKSSDVTTTAAISASAHEKALRIAIVSSGTGIDDGSFVQENYNGICDFIKEHKGAKVTPVMEQSGDPAAAVDTVSGIAADYDVVVCAGYQFAGITSVAEKNPDTKFILVDSFPIDESGNETSADNIYAMTFKEEESGFLAGVAAALSTKTNKVAVVNAVVLTSNMNYQYGFMSGVEYANDTYGTKVQFVQLSEYAGTNSTGYNIGGNYIGSFSDTERGKEIGKALIAKGCDVIFVAAGEAGNGVLEAVKESTEEDYIIGADTDRSRDGVAGNMNVVLTSAVKNMGINDKRVLESVCDGTFKGGNYVLGADTGSTGYISAPERCRLSDDAVKKMDEVMRLITDGKLVIAGPNRDAVGK